MNCSQCDQTRIDKILLLLVIWPLQHPRTPTRQWTMDWAEALSSPMTMTSSWSDVFRASNQWEVVDKLRRLSGKSNSSSTGSTGFVHLCSPDVAHLMVNTHGVIRLFHHFHQDADDGLNSGTNALWALMGSGGITAAMFIDMVQINERELGTPCDWPKMLLWNSTADVWATVNELMTTQSLTPGVDNSAGRAALTTSSARGRSKRSSATWKSRARTTQETDDATEPETNSTSRHGRRRQ